MRLLHATYRICTIVFWSILAIVLLAAGVLLGIYSRWGQEIVREKAVVLLNKQPGTEVTLDGLRLAFPLKPEISGFTMVQDGDTVICADTLRADVRLLPLLRGRVEVADASLSDGFYKIGNADSAMCLTIKAKTLQLHPALVVLPSMDISLDDAYLAHARVDMVLRNDTTPTDTAAAKQTMKIKIKKLIADDLTYSMSMLPTIDSLSTNISRGALYNGLIDLENQKITLQAFKADSVSAVYIAPSPETAAQYPPVPVDTAAQADPWTITIDTIALARSNALYTTRGTVPQPGLDFAYIAASGMDLTILGFYNQASTLRMPLTLHATERCGVTLDATGEFMLNSTEMIFKDFHITSESTDLTVDGMMGMGDMLTDPTVPLRLKAGGHLGISDARLMFPGYGAYLALLPKSGAAGIELDIDGTPAQLSIPQLSVGIKGCATVNAKGQVRNVFDPDRIAGDIDISGNIVNVSSITKALLEPGSAISVPPMIVKGHVSYSPAVTKGNLTATTLGGKIALKALYNSASEGYNLDLATAGFPLNAFLTDMPLGKASVDVKAKGNGFDLFSPRTHMDVSATVKSLVYEGYDYRDINLKAHIAEGNAAIDLHSDMSDLMAQINATGNLRGNVYDWNASLIASHIDLKALNLSPEQATISANLGAKASITSDLKDIDADLHLASFDYEHPQGEISVSGVNAHLLANDTLTSVDVHNRDLVASASTPKNYMYIADAFMAASDLMAEQIKHRKIDVDTLQKALPMFNLHIVAGPDNMLTDLLAPSDMGFSHLAVAATNDSTLNFDGHILGFVTGKTRLDSIDAILAQQAEKMHITGRINNRKGNMDDMAHVTLDGLVNNDKVSMRITQQNVAKETGFDFGAIASLADSSVTARVFPLTPTIGYKKWSLNIDNYLYYNFFTHKIAANLKMKGDKSYIELLSEKPLKAASDSIGTPDLNDIMLKIGDINLADWISFNPFAPPISGTLSANMKMKWDGGSNIDGDGKISLTDFYYDRQRVKDMTVDMNVATNLAGTIHASADLLVDGKRTMTVAGALNDSISGSPFNLDFSLIQFPLNTVNPFLPSDIAQLNGSLNGSMMISGDADRPLINGEIYFSDAAVKAAMTNTAYRFSDVKIPVTNNLVKFTDFSIKGENDNPLYINGTVNVANLTSPAVDLTMKARNLMLVNTQKPSKNAMIYGKAYIDLDATAKGNMRYMGVDADLTILSGTNVTYVMTETATDMNTLANEGMVKFVNLNDTAAVAAADSISDASMLLNLEAQLNIQSGTTINVDLSTNSRDKVQILPQGSLTYTQTPLSEPRLTGRINLNSGFARYTLPVIGSEKYFTLNSGSYVAFNGEMLNPVLNIQATDVMKTNVNIEGQNSRMVNFDILLGVTGTLDQMDVKFDLSTNDDLTVANELQSMSAEQRANQAMNLLLYNVYTGPGTSTNLSTNPLFSFLESQINNWAANNIKGVDLQFGIDQYNQTTNGTTSSAMSYSYQVSKTLFNDRFKIVVGGNYTTDNNADENIAENLINDISFEYYLNTQQTMLVKLFRHMGFESILEGEITQTGVGFVYKRKINSMVKVLPKFMRPRNRKKS